MKRFCRICFLFVTGFVLFFLGMWCSSYLLTKNAERYERNYNDGMGFYQENPSEYIAEEAAVKPTIDLNTDYVIIKENAVTGETEEVTEKLPSRLVGMSLSEVEEFIDDYSKSPALDDREEGLVNAFVESYSSQKLVIHKVYEPLLEEDGFLLRAEENYVIVYYADGRNVYMYTSIRMDTLPAETRTEIEKGKTIDSLDNLYSFLESHTS